MKRIDTATAGEDENGTGRDGFAASVPGVTPATKLDSTWCNHVQEEIARTIELHGDTLDSADFDQLNRVVSTSTEGLVRGGVISGFALTEVGSSLVATLDPGIFWFEGRRYNVTAADLVAADTLIDATPGTDASSITFPASNTWFVQIGPSTLDNDTEQMAVIVSQASGGEGSDRTTLARVTTNGTEITSIESYTSLQRGYQLNAIETPRIRSRSSSNPVHGEVMEFVVSAVVSSATSTGLELLSADNFRSNTSATVFVDAVAHRTDTNAVTSHFRGVEGFRKNQSGTVTTDGTSPVADEWGGGEATATFTLGTSAGNIELLCGVGSGSQTWRFVAHVKIVSTRI